MEIEINKILEDYGERMRRIGIFSFLYNLKDKTQKDKKGTWLDYFGLGILALLFFFENMLLRKNRSSVNNLADFYKHSLSNVEFSELISFASEKQKQFVSHISVLSDKDRNIYNYMLTVDRELDEVHNEHKKLLDESLILQSSALQAAKEALYYVGVKSFNFNRETTASVFSLPVPAKQIKTLAVSFFTFGKSKIMESATYFFASES